MKGGSALTSWDSELYDLKISVSFGTSGLTLVGSYLGDSFSSLPKSGSLVFPIEIKEFSSFKVNYFETSSEIKSSVFFATLYEVSSLGFRI